MSCLCTTKYIFRGKAEDISKLSALLKAEECEYLLLEEACKPYLDSSEVDFRKGEIVSVSDCSSDTCYLEIEIVSAWREPELVFEGLISKMHLSSVEFGYYAIEASNGYANIFATTEEIMNELPKYYYDFYTPGYDCFDGTTNKLTEMIQTFNETLSNLEGWKDSNEGEEYHLAEFIVTDGKENTLLDNCKKLNARFASEESEWYSTILKLKV